MRGPLKSTSPRACVCSPIGFMARAPRTPPKPPWRIPDPSWTMASSVQIEEVAAAWLAKRDSGQWRDADQKALTLWLQASTAHRVAFVRLEAAWQAAQRLRALDTGTLPGEGPPPGYWRLSLFFDDALPPEAAAAQPDH